MRVLELYSGIGGMHCALEKSTLKYTVIKAVDINDTANAVYQHNFPKTLSPNRVLESLTTEELGSLSCDCWVMSPPCQPFTRLGNQKHEADQRCASFVHLLNLIKTSRPNFLLLENVKGFEYSEPWKQLIEILNDVGYHFAQFLLTPLQFGIPNCRLRFYLVATRSPTPFFTSIEDLLSGDCEDKNRRIHRIPPANAPILPQCVCLVCSRQVHDLHDTGENFEAYEPLCQPVSNFLITQPSSLNFAFLDDTTLARYFYVLDIVRPSDRRTRCFTKGYAKRIEGTGSVLQTSSLHMGSKEIHSQWLMHQNNASSIVDFARPLGLRFFHSKEIANLMCFPQNYSFPETVTEKQRIRLLGNSINVLVVAHLLYWAFGSTEQTTDCV